jgi:CRISPR/Cas system-associated exonuclease Cas4 (RecB family)
MRPHLLHRIDTHRDRAVQLAEVVPSASDTPAPETSGRASNWTLPFDPSWIVLPLIAILSGLAAFVLVRSRVAATRAAAASRPATMTVDTRPAAADVFIDGRRVGAAPLVLTVQPGTHTLTLRNGDAERRVVFAAAPGEQLAQYLDLKAAEPAVQTARLSIATDPPGAQVAVDGRPRGLSPVMVDNLTAAEHRIMVTSSSGSIERRITLDAGATKELVFSLPRSPADVGGWVSVASPFQVELFEHGELIGASGTTKVMLPVGRHELVLKNASVGYESGHSVNVAAGRVATIAVVAPQAPLSINAVPWADVAIDGTAIGQTPMGNVMIAVGLHEITFRHPQFGERTQAIVVTATGANRAAVNFTR